MDFQQLLSDEQLKNEFLERIDEIVANAGRLDGLESLEGGIHPGALEAAVESMAAGNWASSGSGLEKIILAFLRPVYLIRNGSFHPPDDESANSRQIAARLESARRELHRAIPSTGRINLRNHRLQWAGTAWMVAPNTVVTNRHVAEQFAFQADGGYAFKRNHRGRPAVPHIDWLEEYHQPGESRFRVEEVIWIEPDGGPDVALLHIAGRGEDGADPPAAISLMTNDEISRLETGPWIGVIGYPGQDSHSDSGDQQRIFDGIYDCKRLAPGRITAISPDELQHDATTLAGNSGSVVLDLTSGKAIGLHIGGWEGDHNYAVPAPRIARILGGSASIP